MKNVVCGKIKDCIYWKVGYQVIKNAENCPRSKIKNNTGIETVDMIYFIDDCINISMMKNKIDDLKR
jgi:hypothetical protein